MNNSSNYNPMVGRNTELSPGVIRDTSRRVLNPSSHSHENHLNCLTNSSSHGMLCSGNGFNKSISTFSSCFPSLTVSMEQNLGADYSQYHSWSSSPPPPALSPVSSSPTHGSSNTNNNNTNNQPSSPSPPIIVAEIRGPSSISSLSASEKSTHAGETFKMASQQIPQTLNKPSANSRCPRIVSDISMSSSSSSSSSTSSSSTLNETIHVTNGLPILEKISIVLGSPIKQAGDNFMVRTNNSSPLKVDEPKLPQLILENHLLSPSKWEEPTEKVDNSIKTNLPDVKEDSKIDAVSTDKPKVTPKRKASARPRRRTKSRKILGDSDSDFEPFSQSQPSGSRGRADARAAISRARQKINNNKRSVGWASSEAVGGTSADIAMRRKYLESPFLCLCQGGKTVSSLLKSSGEVIKSNCIPSGSKTNNLTPDNELVDMSSLSTHIINPALRDLSAQQVGGNSVSNCSIPVNCPFKASNLNGGESVNAEKHDVGIESRSILAGITYRPSGPLRGRDYQFPTSVNPKSLWICAFCGEDNKYTELGCLYGPYWLTEADIKQLPSELTYSSTEEYKLTPDGETQSKTPTSPVSRRTKSIEKVIRSGVITSTTTRSAAAQGRTTVANTGVLRLVIKASGAQRLLKNPPNECKTSNESSTFLKPRVGSGGEVWFHFECVLWAPGTYMKGNGVIGGLGEALQLALNAKCSFCYKPGAILSCCNRGCNLSYHYQCAHKAECHLDREQYILLCKKHHIYS